MGQSNANVVRSQTAKATDHIIKAVGGSSAVTKVTGPGVTITRTGTGAYLLTWAADPGNSLGAIASLQATTASALAGHVVICGPFVVATRTMAVTVTNASDAAHDLAALEWFNVRAAFSFTSLDV
jgi:ABC-type spermidine/putrescine transport system permease subunit II